MANTTSATKTISLNEYGITHNNFHYQLSSDDLHQATLDKGLGKESSLGALAVSTGEFTGRSPLDRFIVKDEITSEKIWWGNINIPFEPKAFDRLYDKVIDYLNEKELYVRDAYVCADPAYKMNIRVINEYPWSNMFVYNMFLRPNE